MNNEEMRKMWEEAANRNKNSAPSDGNRHIDSPRRGTAAAAAMEKDYKKYEFYKARKQGKKMLDIMIDKIQNGPKAAARKLETEKDKTEETP